MQLTRDAKLAVFYEHFEPTRPSFFDYELDGIVTEYTVAKKALTGFCNLAGCETVFRLTSDNLREDLKADISGSNNRQRQMVCALSLALFGTPLASMPEIISYINRHQLKVFTAEANSAFFEVLRAGVEPELLTYSEYFGDEYRSGMVVNGIMHQDLQATSFADETFDIILTADVFEHIPDAPKAEKEVLRILKSGGIYCFTVPTSLYDEHDNVLAELDADSQIRYFGPPQYHSDPVRPDDGILVFRIFSCNDLAARFTALGGQYVCYRFWSKSLGILGGGNTVHAVKKAVPASRLASAPFYKNGLTDAAVNEVELAPLPAERRVPDETVNPYLLKNLLELQTVVVERERQLLELSADKTQLHLQIKELQNWALDMEQRLKAPRPGFKALARRLRKFSRLG